MPRIACLLVPDLPIAAACRADPDLAGRPLALSAGTGTHAPIVAAAAAARARGVRVGHTVAQSLAIAADLVVRPRDETAERSAVRALVDVAASLASRIEAAADGAVFLDAAGAAHLIPSEAGLATALVARAARVGLAARAAVGASMTVARLAALHATEVVPAGTELGFLAPLPLACLAPPPAIAATLERWGIRRLGDLARLPVAEVATRLGPAGAALVRAARGGRAGRARRRPGGRARRADRALHAAGTFARAARDHARTARRSLRCGARRRAGRRRLPPAGRGRRGAVHARRRACAAVRQRLPARRACAPAAASRRGVRGPRPPRLRARRGPRRAGGRRGGPVAGGRGVVERRRLRARLLRPRALRRRPLPLLPGERPLVRRWRV